MPESSPFRVFLLSPASCSGERARILLRDEAAFDLARRLRSDGAPIGEVFAFLSGLYFRGKLTYARAFGRAPHGIEPVLIITPTAGLLPAHTVVTRMRMRRFARVDIADGDARFLRPFRRDARRLAAALPRDAEVVLLGSIATRKYFEPIADLLGPRLLFPPDFVGRGDMSRGGLLLRAARSGAELAYGPIAGAARKGSRPAKLTPVRGILPSMEKMGY
ncbi:MAG TPA: hypothetical protein VH854_13310 [Thermoanaerobaculia bacterium]|nr:hypothetical protein [Thermoanaerobaculia bacterium]